jgi:hypothetical protein
MKLFKLFIPIVTIIVGFTSAFQQHLSFSAVHHPIHDARNNNGKKKWKLYSTVYNNNGAILDVSERAYRDVRGMDEWVAACGAQRADGIQLTTAGNYDDDSDADVSIMTTQDLAPDTPVLFIPAAMILSANQIMQEYYGRMDAAEKLLRSLNALDQWRHFHLMIKILVELEMGDRSPFYPWLNSLPRYFSNGASMTPFCYECLPPLVASLAMKERNNYIYLESALQQVPYLISPQIQQNKDITKWAFQIAYTRSFEEVNDGSGDLRIVPLADMINHGTETEVQITYDGQGNCYAMTTKYVPAGSPLRMSYGDPTNPSFLFARYGFVDDSAPATFCKIMIPHKNTELENMGYAHNRMLFYKDTGDVSEEVWDVLLYQILSASNVASRRTFYQAHMNGDYATKQAFHQQYYPETSAKLKEHIDTFLQELDELSAKACNMNVNQHPRAPLILKHNELVKNSFLAVRARYFSY